MLNIITAFEAEARPFIDHLGLIREQSNPDVNLYSASEINLGICGIGAGNAKKMTQYLLGKTHSEGEQDECTWLNFGVAGAGSLPVGELVCAATVTSVASGRKWELARIHQYTGTTGDVFTVDQPVSNYLSGRVYDMESAGVLSALGHSTRAGDIMIVKLVSDNPYSPVNSLSVPGLHAHINKHRTEIASLADLLIE